ncbi:MAG: RsmB/NOP family class I SAM-dependent RNA methyltransferase, partial [Candidatus Hodarchaeales archaeon]
MSIIEILTQWIAHPKNTHLVNKTKEKSKRDYHYFNEIVRFFNQIQFVVNKTRRSLSEETNIEIAYYLYTAYCYLWEKSSFTNILRDTDNKLSSDDKKTLLKFYKRLSTWNWDISLQNKDEIEVLSIKYAAPSYFIQKLLPVLDYKQIQQNIVAMDQRSRKGATYLRINTAQMSNKKISDQKAFFIEYFGEKGVKLETVDYFPSILQAKVQDKGKIVTSSYYRQNHLIFQEKASVAAVHLLNPKSGEIIIDLCAAPGMKTSLISQISTGQSIIIAGDFHTQRINEMITFLSSLGITNVHEIQWDGIQLPLEEESVDRILLDAPCTGSGTFTSNPELKWRQSNKFLRRNVLLQEKLLKAALNALKVGGTLVYSVCSLYPEEGEYQIQKIIDQHVTPAATPSWLPPCYKINNSYIKGTGRFLP